MHKPVSLAALAFCALAVSATSALALPVGSATFSPGNISPTFNTLGNDGKLLDLTSIAFLGGATLVTSSAGGPSNILANGGGDVLMPTKITIGNSVFTLSDIPVGNGSTGAIGTFSATSPFVVQSSSFNPAGAGSASETLFVTGTLSGGTDEIIGGNATTLSADLTLVLSQTGGAGQAISLAGTISTPASFAVPEPASLALLGAGLFGAGLARRRRG